MRGWGARACVWGGYLFSVLRLLFLFVLLLLAVCIFSCMPIDYLDARQHMILLPDVVGLEYATLVSCVQVIGCFASAAESQPSALPT